MSFFTKERLSGLRHACFWIEASFCLITTELCQLLCYLEKNVILLHLCYSHENIYYNVALFHSHHVSHGHSVFESVCVYQENVSLVNILTNWRFYCILACK